MRGSIEGADDGAFIVSDRVHSARNRECPFRHRRKGSKMDRDRIEGNLKEAEGKLTGDEVREKQGQGQDTWGKAKDKVDDVKDEVDERT
jgi:uncharacterized protein YjbJ (UPF0337 family)